jgi:hypothetical protein
LNRGIEAQLTRLGYAQLVTLAELDQRNIVGELRLRGLPDYLVADLRCSRAAAKAKAHAMERLCAKRSLTGEPVEAAHPTVAAALTTAEVNFEHANVIATVVESLPDLVRAERGPEVEATLIRLARTEDPRTLKLLADRIVAHLDPDGAAPEEIDQPRSADVDW